MSGPADIQPGHVIGHKFRVLRLLGTGAMGKVFLAQQNLLGRQVAVKVLRPTLAADRAMVDQFHREAVAASKIRHPNVALIYDYGGLGNTLFIAMEYVDGQSLGKTLKRHGRLRVDDAVEIAENVASALDAAHRQGVLHRDIKPHNVLLGLGPEGLRVKVVDFGIAKLLDRGNSVHTNAGLVMGTPEYMAPEQATGKRSSQAMDLYSLGVVLFQMLEGHPPFQGDSRGDVIDAHLAAPVPPLGPHVPVGLAKLVHQLLEKDPADRPASAQAVVGALRRSKRLLQIREQNLLTDPGNQTTVTDWLSQAETRVESTLTELSPIHVERPPRPEPCPTDQIPVFVPPAPPPAEPQVAPLHQHLRTVAIGFFVLGLVLLLVLLGVVAGRIFVSMAP